MTRQPGYDVNAMWLVLGKNGEQSVVYTFNDRPEAQQFSREAGVDRSAPIEVARSPLEQAAPLLCAASQVALAAIEENKRNPADGRALRRAATFLRTVLDFVKMDQQAVDIYRQVRTGILRGNAFRSGPEAALVPRLRHHLEHKRSIKH